MKNQVKWVRDRWVLLASSLAITILLSVALGFRLGALTRGISQQEINYIRTTDSGSKIAHNPTLLAHKAPTYVLNKLSASRPGIFRAVSAVFAALGAFGIYFILKRWYSLRVAILGSWLFITSSWVLHVGRLAAPESVYLLLLPFIAAIIWMTTTNRHGIGMIILCALVSLSLYIPGFVWLALALLLWQRKPLLQIIKEQPGTVQTVCGILIMTGILPLLLATIVSPVNLLSAAGLPSQLPTPLHVLKNIVSVPQQLFLQGPADSVRWLGRLPLLDAFSAVMMLLGIYSLRYNIAGIKTQLLGATSLVFIILVALGGVPITALLPLVFIFIGSGIAFMLQQWFTVFPRNPVARGIGTTLMSVAVLLVSFHHINHYFIAWPQTPATRQVFNQSLVK